MTAAWSPPEPVDLERLLRLEPAERSTSAAMEALAERLDDDQIRPLLARILTRLVALDVKMHAPPELAFAVWVPRKSERYLMATFPGWLERYVFSACKCTRSWPCSLCARPIMLGSRYYRGDRTRTQKLRRVRICWACGERLSPAAGLQAAEPADISLPS